MKSVIDILPWSIHSNAWTSQKEIWNEYIIQYLYLVEAFLIFLLTWCFFQVWCNLCSFILSYWGLCIYKEGGKVLREPSLVRMIWKEGPLKKNMFSFIWKKSIFLSCCVFYCNIWVIQTEKLWDIVFVSRIQLPQIYHTSLPVSLYNNCNSI